MNKTFSEEIIDELERRIKELYRLNNLNAKNTKPEDKIQRRIEFGAYYSLREWIGEKTGELRPPGLFSNENY